MKVFLHFCAGYVMAADTAAAAACSSGSGPGTDALP